MSAGARAVALAVVLAVVTTIGCTYEKEKPKAVTSTTIKVAAGAVGASSTTTTRPPLDDASPVAKACALVDFKTLGDYAKDDLRAKEDPTVIYEDATECRVQAGSVQLNLVLFPGSDVKTYTEVKKTASDAEEVDGIENFAFYTNDRVEMVAWKNTTIVRLQFVGGVSHGDRVRAVLLLMMLHATRGFD